MTFALSSRQSNAGCACKIWMLTDDKVRGPELAREGLVSSNTVNRLPEGLSTSNGMWYLRVRVGVGARVADVRECGEQNTASARARGHVRLGLEATSRAPGGTSAVGNRTNSSNQLVPREIEPTVAISCNQRVPRLFLPEGIQLASRLKCVQPRSLLVCAGWKLVSIFLLP
jgi:hypothetical protein